MITIKLNPFPARELEWLCRELGWDKTEAISQAIIHISGDIKEYHQKGEYEASQE